MTVPAKLALPQPLLNLPSQPALDQAIGDKTTLFSAPAGYLFTSRLAGILAAREARVIWLRVGPEDRDPATLLLALIGGAETIFPGIGERTLNTLRHQPGGIYGWPPLYACLARDVAEQAEAAQPRYPLALVFQHVDALAGTPRTLALLIDHFLPLLPQDTIRILASHTPLPRSSLPGYLQQFSARDLRLDEYGAGWLAQNHFTSGGGEMGLPAASLRRILALTDGRGVALEGILAAGQALGAATIRRAAEAADNGEHFLARIMHSYLDHSPAPSADLLGLAIHLEYLHPGLSGSVLGQAPSPTDGWLIQPLADDWLRLRCVWREPLRRSLPPDQAHNRELLKSAAQFMIQQNAYETGIPLLLDLNDPQEAARVLVQVVEPLMDRGQWETLSGWLARLPEPVRRDWPWLVYAEGELAAARGQPRAARRVFATATQLFYEHRDYKGACQSLLTEATLSAWDEEPERAQQYSRQAQTLAGSAGLAWYQAWAAWLSGSLAASEGRLEEALREFTGAAQAAAAVKDPRTSAYIEQARGLAQAQLELRQQTDQHQRALEEAEQSERDISDRLRFLLANPTHQSGDLLHLYGWSQAPLFLKLPQKAAAPVNALPIPDRLVNRLVDWLKPRFTSQPEPPGARAAPLDPASRPSPEPLPVTGKASPTASPEVAVPSASAADEPPTGPLSHSGKPALNAYLLGDFRVIHHGASVDRWPSGRARAVFAYLLMQRGRPVPREVIMETFWPDAALESARNSLNVAVYSLRQTLKNAFGTPLVQFRENAYQISPEVALWLDAESFERHALAGRDHETAGQPAAAIHQYELALSLYQGDLLVENLYEDWPVVERERLRVLYMETLDRLSLIYYDQAQYASCAALCQRMLQHDSCREDAHCRLMRCYSRQGQNHLALRQYQTCVEALRGELDVAPSPATVQLYEQVRRREAI